MLLMHDIDDYLYALLYSGIVRLKFIKQLNKIKYYTLKMRGERRKR